MCTLNSSSHVEKGEIVGGVWLPALGSAWLGK